MTLDYLLSLLENKISSIPYDDFSFIIVKDIEDLIRFSNNEITVFATTENISIEIYMGKDKKRTIGETTNLDEQSISNFINSEFISENKFLGSAYDADSEGVEGKYYVWKYEELKHLLNNELELFEKKYLITREGNFEGSNILVEKKDINLSETEEKKLIEIETKVLNERKKRVKPFFDDKVQTDLNCYWLYSNLFSSLVLNNDELLKNTINKIKSLNDKFKDKIFHCYDNK